MFTKSPPRGQAAKQAVPEELLKTEHMRFYQQPDTSFHDFPKNALQDFLCPAPPQLSPHILPNKRHDSHDTSAAGKAAAHVGGYRRLSLGLFIFSSWRV